MASFDRPAQDRGWATRQERSSTNANGKSLSSSSATAADKPRHFSSSYDRGDRDRERDCNRDRDRDRDRAEDYRGNGQRQQRYDDQSNNACDSIAETGSRSGSGSGEWRAVTSTTTNDGRDPERRDKGVRDRDTGSNARRGATNDDRQRSSTSRHTSQYDSSNRADDRRRDDELDSNSNRVPFTASRRDYTSPTRQHPSKGHDDDNRRRSMNAPPPTRSNRDAATFSRNAKFNPSSSSSRKSFPIDSSSSTSTSRLFYPVQRRQESDVETNVSRSSASNT
ncbi:BQ2448_6127 [Microbotryum intermedium]|uniref:BQ2448_6127 protein n=1 Tax=Microbotryum intermedium TaxID=269621 RepID=A0A238FKB4_9BASI|nr:BQ2448_6127 [Microbotryum intermedium]